MAYNLGPVKPHVRAAAEEVGEKFGYANIGGYRSQGSVPNSDHPKGLALDFMTLSKPKGDATAAYLIANAQRLGVTYVIYWRRIWQNGAWRAYTGPSPHLDHVHASFTESGSASGVVTTPVAIPGASALSALGDLDKIAAMFTDAAMWKRIGIAVLGIALIIGGVLFLLQPKALETATTVAEVIK